MNFTSTIMTVHQCHDHDRISDSKGVGNNRKRYIGNHILKYIWYTDLWKITNIAEFKLRVLFTDCLIKYIFLYRYISACRAVWVHRQDLAIAESVFCHYTVRYMYICACICHMLVTMCFCVQSL